jgi:hypothetical protein
VRNLIADPMIDTRAQTPKRRQARKHPLDLNRPRTALTAIRSHAVLTVVERPESSDLADDQAILGGLVASAPASSPVIVCLKLSKCLVLTESESGTSSPMNSGSRT